MIALASLLFAKLIILLPIVLVGFLIEDLRAAERRKVGYRRNIVINCVCTVLYFSCEILISAAIAYVLADTMARLPGAGLIALPQQTEPTATFIVVMTLVWAFIMDFGNYWFHRLQHASPWLWAEHEVHHSDEHMNVTSAYRHHWLEGPLKTLAIGIPITYLFVPPAGIAAASAVAGILFTCFAHLNARIGFGRFNCLLLTPQMHRIHHSKAPAHIDRNFAFLCPLWDVVFGTYYHPQPNEYPETGLASGETIQTTRELVTWPFERWRQMLRRRLARRHAEI